MKVKFNLKSFTVITAGAIIAAIAISLIIVSIVSHKPTAAFYGINSETQKEIISILQTTHKRKNSKSLPFITITLDDSISLEKNLKKHKADILFIKRGINAEYAQKKALKKRSGFSQEILNGMISNIKQIAPLANNSVTAVPLLIDNLELNINNEKYQTSSLNSIFTFAELEQFTKITKSSTPYPLIFPAGDNDFLINLFGALIEATSGKDAWMNTKDKITALTASGKENFNSYTQLLNELSSQGQDLYETVQLLKSWMNSNIIPKNISQLTMRDIKAFMNNNLCSASIMTLSEHRTFDRNIISQYSSTFLPATEKDINRAFSSPVIMAVSLSKDKVARNAIEKLANELQTSLSMKTGLAPVQANANVPDIQADDLRYWIAASSAPLPALSDALFTTKQQKAAFADAIRTVLK